MWNFVKIRVGRIALLHAETHGRADMTKLMVAFAATLRTLLKSMPVGVSYVLVVLKETAIVSLLQH